MTGSYVHTLWCDDIRQEIGNKPSFMGVYTGRIVLGELPAVLPRLGVFTWVNTPIDRPFKQLTLRLVRDDGFVVLELKPGPVDASNSVDVTKPNDVTRSVFGAAFAVAPLEFPAGCRYFMVVVDIDGEVLEGPKLRVEVNADAIARLNPALGLPVDGMIDKA